MRLRALVLIAALAGGAFLFFGTGSGREAGRGCPAGQLVMRGEDGRGEKEEGTREKGDYESYFRGRCAPGQHPESARDLARFTEYATGRLGADSPRALARATAQRERMQGAASDVPGTGGSWTPYGKGPLIGDDPTYPATLGDGFGKINGRVNDVVYSPQTKKLYAAVAQGGVWESANMGGNWTPIGDNLPIQSTGSLGYTPAGGGTLIVATGDHAFSNDYAGVGTFWTTDEGRTWHKSRGAPDGALSFRVFVDPTNADVVYLATGLGLYRSDDAGRSFTNVDLPTGDCAGDSSKPNCFFANVVTDVAVQPTDKFGHKGGAVIAAIGWRDGQRPNFNGKPAAPANGLYRSDNGKPGTFTKLPDSAGFTPTDRAGRTEFGTSTGPDQDGRYLYAVAQDAKLFAGSLGGEQDIPLVGTPSVLDAIYVSSDFGKTWQVMESRQEFFNPANGSSLSSLTALGIAPGYQVTYNEFIKPDPTRASPTGVPTRVLLGMEEVWQTTSTLTPQDGHSQFQAFGQYTANGGACLVVPEQCGTKQAVAGNTTTHPDQHGVALVPDGNGGVTLIVTDDGGVYTQHAAQGEEFTQLKWGEGANQGFNTLLPYGAAMAKDGTVYAGLQDNGQLKILPNGEQHTVYVGDGTNALVDPDNSKVNYDELPDAGINVSTDGGESYSSIDPLIKSPEFVAPMLMDPGDAKHIMVAGREIAETTSGPDTTTCRPDDPSCTASDTDWKYVYDLGTHLHPADANAEDDANDAPNITSAAALNGDNAYAGFCGDCDPVKLRRPFHVGFATNVGGSKPPKRSTSDGWHITKADGLPDRLISGVAADPSDPKTVYVTLGATAFRYFAPIGSLGESTEDVGKGHVFKSTDAGETWKDVSGNLPDVQATSVVVRDGQLVIGTSIGVFASKNTNGGTYALLGDGLPAVAIYSLQLKPGDPGTLMAATFGRGVWTYRFRNGGVATTCATAKPFARFTRKSIRAARHARAGRRMTLRGTAKTRKGCGKIRKVQVSVEKRASHKRCRYMRSNGKFGRPSSCRRPKFIAAKGRSKWRFTTRRKLRRGTYIVRARSIDTRGKASPTLRKRHTRITLRVH